MKKTLSILLSLIMIVTMLPTFAITAFADDSGTCGENLNWFFKDDVLTIEGTGEMVDFNYNETLKWTSTPSAIHHIKEVILPEGLTSIGRNAFKDVTDLKKVNIPSTVETIGYGAFANTAIKDIVIPDSVTSTYAPFNDCIIDSITLGNGQSEYGGFLNGVVVKSIIVADDNEIFKTMDNALYSRDGKVLYKLFNGSDNETFIVPKGVERIYASAFNRANNLKAIYMFDTVTDIAGDTFSNAENLETLVLSNSVTNISSTTFCECSSLKALGLPEALVTGFSYDYNIFKNTSSLESVYIPAGYTTRIQGLNNDAYHSPNLKNIYLGGSLEAFDAGTKAEFSKPEYTVYENHTHVYTTNETLVSPTCKSAGIDVETCECGKGKLVETGTLSHNYTIEKSAQVNPTCTTAGKTAVMQCANCTATIGGETIPTIEHVPQNVTAIAPTCTETGLTEGSHCSVCGDIIVPQNLVDALGHSFGDNLPACSVCGTANPSYVAPAPAEPSNPTTPVVVAPAPTPTVVTVKLGSESIKPNKDGEYVSKKATKPTISKLAKDSKSFKITWKKVKSVSGYQVQYSTSSKFTKKTSKKVTYSGNKSFTKTVKKLKGNKKYYVRVRTYKTVKANGKSYKIYSAWSKVKPVTTKK